MNSMDSLSMVKAPYPLLSMICGMLVMVNILQVTAQCIGTDCPQKCDCPEKADTPCNIAGLIVANVIVSTPLLIVCLFLPMSCCFTSCRNKNSDKPPQVMEMPFPSFAEMSPEGQTSEEEDDDSEGPVFQASVDSSGSQQHGVAFEMS